MRFLVGARLPDVVLDAFDEPPERVDTTDDLLDALATRDARAVQPGAGGKPDRADVLLVHAPSYEGDLEQFIKTVRANQAGDEVPIVFLVEDSAVARELPIDGVVTLPTDARTLSHVTDRAARLEAYRSAVGRFYDACREWSGGEFDRDLLEHRYEADQLFSDLAPIEEDVPLDTLLRERYEESGDPEHEP